MIRYLKTLDLFLLLFGSFSFCLGCKSEPVEVIEELEEIVIGCDEHSPYFFINENGELDGIDYSLASEAYRRMGYEAVFRLIDWSDKVSQLNSGSVDCLWGAFSINGEEDEYQWTGSYLKSRQVVVVLENSEINTLNDLKEKRIGVQSSTKAEDIFSLKEDEKLPNIKELYCFEDMNLAFAALRKGYIDAVSGYEEVMKYNINNSIPDYKILDETLFISNLGVAFSKSYDKNFVQELTSILEKMNEDGFIQETVIKYESKGAIAFWYMQYEKNN